MMSEKEFRRAVRGYIKEKEINNDNLYDYLNEKQIGVIRKYYEVYTKFLFSKIMGTLRLEVSSSKAAKLVELKGTGSWEFAGMKDMLRKGAATCELGHPLRYVYSAINVVNGEVLQFGVRCVGDFFDIDEKGVMALSKVKDVMLSELKDMVSIKEQNLFTEHFRYECGNLGSIYLTMGIEGIKKVLHLTPLMPIAIEFIAEGLPLPQSLVDEVVKLDSTLGSMLENSEFLGIDVDAVNMLKASPLTLVSQIFSNAEAYILTKIKVGVLGTKKSDFYNLNSIEDINVGASIWKNRNDRLLKAYEYFKDLNISDDWVRMYKFIVEKGYKRDKPDIYFGLEILMLFAPNITVTQTFGYPKDYTYKGYNLNDKAKVKFDALIDYMATREFIMALKEITNMLNEVDRQREQAEKEIEDMMAYLKNNLEDETKYKYVAGRAGVIDIVINKGLDYHKMTDKQQKYVKGVYDNMQAVDKRNTSTNITMQDREVNNRYKLVDKPDILAKIQRLQVDAGNELTEKELGIIQSIMTYKQVSDKQINRINEAYSKYILGEEVQQDVSLPKTLGNRKWHLMERSDVKEKILRIQAMPEYLNIPEGVRNIFENILKYNSVSDKQIETVERTYRRYFKG